MIEIVSRREIQAGWSGDKKYRVRSADGGEYLLRVTSGEKATSRRAMFEMQRAVAALGVPMCQPEEYWENAEGANILQRWVEGEDARDALPKLAPQTQYALGARAGQWLNMIHSLPA
ncbi:MAG: phosphotransferase, partial [Clostridia bacterium]|nr:phosphotransferase [Clostridia bacterium]